jgi:hypothetical protein
MIGVLELYVELRHLGIHKRLKNTSFLQEKYYRMQ